jgi:hypothetical protein
VLNTTEDEYVAACAVVWLQKLLFGLFGLVLEASCIWCDNHSCMKFSENPMFHDRSKHIEIRYYYIGDMVQKGAVRLQSVTNEDQVVDVFTKPLSRMKFKYFRDKRQFSHPTCKRDGTENKWKNLI